MDWILSNYLLSLKDLKICVHAWQCNECCLTTKIDGLSSLTSIPEERSFESMKIFESLLDSIDKSKYSSKYSSAFRAPESMKYIQYLYKPPSLTDLKIILKDYTGKNHCSDLNEWTSWQNAGISNGNDYELLYEHQIKFGYVRRDVIKSN